MEELSSEAAEAWLRRPTIVLVPGGNPYAVSFVLDALTQDEVFAQSGPRVEVRGPLGHRKTRHLWITSFNDGQLLPTLDPDVDPTLAEEAQSAVDAWYAWQEALDG